MKKLIIFFCIVSMSLTLCACGDEVPELTDEQNQLIAEYSAGLLMKYDKRSPRRLVDDYEESVPEVLEEEPVVEEPVIEEIAPEPMDEEINDETADAEVQYMDAGAFDLGAFLEANDCVFTYDGFEISSSYEDDNSYFSLEASNGKMFVIIKYLVKSSDGQDKNVNMRDYKFRVRVNPNNIGNRMTLTTMLPNDLMTYAGIIGASEKELVVISEIPAADAIDLNSLVITFKNGDKKQLLKLK